MSITDTELFDKTRDALWDSERLIAWDGCHKMYVAMDAEQADWFRENYPHVVENDDVDLLLATLGEWWEESCALRFISGVATNHNNPNAGFTDLIAQGEDWDDDDEDEE